MKIKFHCKYTQISPGQDTIHTFENMIALMLENFLHKLGNTAGLSSTTETGAIMKELEVEIKLGWWF